MCRVSIEGSATCANVLGNAPVENEAVKNFMDAALVAQWIPGKPRKEMRLAKAEVAGS